jgi:GTPase-activating protein BEM2
LDEVGLYRVPGSVASVKALIAALDSGEDVDMDDERWIDVNVVAGTFKSWLRALPDSILTPELYEKFIQAAGLQDYEEKCYVIRNLVHQLPTGNFNLLQRVIQHLKRFAVL